MIIIHPKAKTNFHIRKLIQESHESIASLALKFRINPKTVLKWKNRENCNDLPYGAKTHKKTLTSLEEKIIAKVRQHLKCDLDDLIEILTPYIPRLNKSNCYRVLLRRELNHLPSPFINKGKGKFKEYLPGFVHVDLGYLPILKGSFKRKYFIVGIDRITKIVFVKIVNGKTQKEAVSFLKNLVRFFPYHIHRILTDNGKEVGKEFSLECERLNIRHKRTKIKHPWTNGQAEVTVKIIKKETIQKVFYQDYFSIEKDLLKWQNEYNLNRKLKSLKGLTPFGKMVEYYQSLTEEKQKSRFKRPINMKFYTTTW